MVRCWCITDGSAGMRAQTVALAKALGLSYEVKIVRVKPVFAWLPNMICAKVSSLVVPFFLENKNEVSGALPELVITCGRRSAMVSMGLRARAPQVKFIHIQDPHVASRYFDMVVAMGHDAIRGGNVIKTRFALHAIDKAALEEARAAFSPVFAGYGKPQVAVLLGGSTNRYNFSEAAMREVISQLERFLNATSASLLITPSRRTGEGNIALLRQAFAGNSRVYIYDFAGENPYLGLLACADAIVVTDDSVNMMSEAQATGKPVYLLPLPGHANTKPARFARALVEDGIARELGEKLEQWSYPASDEMQKLAAEIKAQLNL